MGGAGECSDWEDMPGRCIGGGLFIGERGFLGLLCSRRENPAAVVREFQTLDLHSLQMFNALSAQFVGTFHLQRFKPEYHVFADNVDNCACGGDRQLMVEMANTNGSVTFAACSERAAAVNKYAMICHIKDFTVNDFSIRQCHRDGR